jgi:hypothetical protein
VNYLAAYARERVGEGESERYLLTRERRRERMSKIKKHLEESISWGELAQLTHATQVERFNWCACEEQEQFPYVDCPREGERV